MLLGSIGIALGVGKGPRGASRASEVAVASTTSTPSNSDPAAASTAPTPFNPDPAALNRALAKELPSLDSIASLVPLSPTLANVIYKLNGTATSANLTYTDGFGNHVAFDALQISAPIPLVSIIEAAADAATGLSRLGLFATRFTVKADLYRPVFARKGIEVVAPSEDDQALIHRKYFEELTAGRFLPETRAQLLEVAERMRADQNVDGIILGGTELPLLLPDESWNGLPFLDTTRIHAEAVVARLLA